jgi:hypothetical protein
LLKYRDEYSRKSGQTQVQEGEGEGEGDKDTEVDTEVEKEVEQKKQKRSRKSAPEIEIPDWVPSGPWNAFLEMRKDIKAPLTEKAMVMAINTLDRLRKTGSEPVEVLNQSTMRSWRGLFEVKNGGNGNGKANGRQSQSVQEVLRELGATGSPDSGGGGGVTPGARQARESTPDEVMGAAPDPVLW